MVDARRLLDGVDIASCIVMVDSGGFMVMTKYKQSGGKLSHANDDYILHRCGLEKFLRYLFIQIIYTSWPFK